MEMDSPSKQLIIAIINNSRAEFQTLCTKDALFITSQTHPLTVAVNHSNVYFVEHILRTMQREELGTYPRAFFLSILLHYHDVAELFLLIEPIYAFSSYSGLSSLEFAVLHFSMRTIQLILRVVDHSQIIANGMSMAIEQDNLEAATLIYNHCNKEPEYLCQAIELHRHRFYSLLEEDAQYLDVLLAVCENSNLKAFIHFIQLLNEDEFCLLKLAKFGFAGAVVYELDYLRKNHADRLYLLDENGNSALFYACLAESYESVKQLLFEAGICRGKQAIEKARDIKLLELLYGHEKQYLLGDHELMLAIFKYDTGMAEYILADCLRKEEHSLSLLEELLLSGHELKEAYKQLATEEFSEQNIFGINNELVTESENKDIFGRGRKEYCELLSLYRRKFCIM